MGRVVGVCQSVPVVQNFNNSFTYHLQKVIEAMDKLLEDPTDIETLNPTDRHQVAIQLLKYMEQTLRTLAQFLPKGSFTYTSPSNTGKAPSRLTPRYHAILDFHSQPLSLSLQNCR